MFGWMGTFEDGMMFALVDSGLLFFRVDDSNRVEFEAAGSSQFGKMPYFEVPGDVADDPDRLVTWGRAALEAARRAKVGGRPASR